MMDGLIVFIAAIFCLGAAAYLEIMTRRPRRD